ncbi:cell division protein FtsQ/DivIB [Polaribacter tangerinus]|uniref:cell division protein FtsQ/DivIB n=1 Tax=Polaribacter tangerinus TaxID=1920034 RepID=UPI000B4AA90C|nr:cell division protein FtsQ [Polaribacter tangerinus]
MKLKSFLKYLFFLMLIVSLAFLYGFSKKRNSVKKVAQISVEFEDGTNHFLTHAMVDKLLIQNNETIRNKAKSLIDLYKLEEYVISNPYIEKARVFLTIDGIVKAIVKQRTPVARLLTDNGSYYIDKQGVKVPLAESYSARVMLISGVQTDKEIAVTLPLINSILEDSFLKNEVVGIKKYADDEYEFSVRSGDYKIDFGKLEDSAIKFKKIKAFYNTTFKDKTIQNYKTINVKYHNQVVCSK